MAFSSCPMVSVTLTNMPGHKDSSALANRARATNVPVPLSIVLSMYSSFPVTTAGTVFNFCRYNHGACVHRPTHTIEVVLR